MIFFHFGKSISFLWLEFSKFLWFKWYSPNKKKMRKLLSILFLFGFIAASCQPACYTFVFLNKKPSASQVAKDTVEKLMKGHLANIERLAKEDKLIAAGPFEGGGGIFILNTTSKSQAEEWLSTDPGVRANLWDIEILPYSPKIGAVCKAGEPYEMVSYGFVRFYELSRAGEKAVIGHEQLIGVESEKGNVVASGIFEPSGQILVMKNEALEKLLESSPAVKQGILKAEQKKLWIAKGSFCEK